MAGDFANLPAVPDTVPIVVAIPVCNEQSHLTACLDALAGQTRPADAIILLLNNCRDDSESICRHASRSCSAIRFVTCNLSAAEASAGEARARAFDLALGCAGDGVILTTDADAVVPATWIADNLAVIAQGVDCVCGMAEIAPGDCPASDDDRSRLIHDAARETRLLGLHDEIAASIDPDPFDPWPRHQQNSGASIALRAASLREAGGPPRVRSSEDRALIARLAMNDVRIRHAPHIRVMVSGRSDGRAAGGMAETIRRRLQRQDRVTDEVLEPTIDAYRRVLARRRFGALRDGEAAAPTHIALAKDLLIATAIMRSALDMPRFGAAWEFVQRASPILQRRRVGFPDLDRETRQAEALVRHLRIRSDDHEAIMAWRTARHAL